MIPKELKRDDSGVGRIARIEYADQLIAEARAMAAACMADVDRGFSDFSDDDTLLEAAHHYEKAGLVLLAERVRKLGGSCVVTGWREFDEANAASEI